MNSETEQRLREALDEVGALVTQETLKPLPALSTPRRPRVDVRHAVAAVAIVIAGATATTLWLPHGGAPDVNSAATRPTVPYENIDISVFVCAKKSPQPSCKSRPKGATDKDLKAIQTKIKSFPQVTYATYEDQAKVLETFKATTVDETLKRTVRLEDLQASFRIELTPNADATPLITALKSRPGVAAIVDHRCTPLSRTPNPHPTTTPSCT